MIQRCPPGAACSSRSEKQAKSKDPYNSTDAERES
jgi:hypothetical protein